MAGPCSIPCSTNPGTGSSPHWGSSVPGSVRNFASLNLPWLQVLWAAASLMPGARAGQCSSPRCIGNMNQAGERFPKISAHFWGVSAAPLDCTMLLPATEQAPSERIRSQCGERWATSHRQEPWGAGGSGGVHKQKGEHPFWSTAVRLQRLLGRGTCWALVLKGSQHVAVRRVGMC